MVVVVVVVVVVDVVVVDFLVSVSTVLSMTPPLAVDSEARREQSITPA